MESQTFDTGAELDPEREKQLAREYLRRNVYLLIILVIVILALAMLAKGILGERLNRWIAYLTTNFGYTAVAGIIWGIDTFTLPISPDVILAVIAHPGSKLDYRIALGLICIASMVGGVCGYYLARALGSVGFIRRRLQSSESRGHAMFSRYGIWAVVIAGLTPIPFSIVCWMAGLYGMRPLPLVLATLSRIPRMVGWFYLLRFGFSI